MRDAMAFVRTLIFNVIFYSISLFWVLAALAVLPVSRRAFQRVAFGWSRLHRFCTHWLLGQHVVVEGVVPSGPHFYAVKHEAMFETLDLQCILPAPAIVAKQELLDIPLWGRAARAYGLIGIDRSAGAKALRVLREGVRGALAEGRSVCLFPEGTRVPHGESPPLKAGFAGIYALIGAPVVPVAVDSGRLNRRGRFIRYSGIIRYRFGAPIPTGLDRREAEAQVHAAINLLNG